MTCRSISRGLLPLLLAAAGLNGCISNPIQTTDSNVPAPESSSAMIDADDPGSADLNPLPPLAVIDFDPEKETAAPHPEQNPPDDLWERMRRDFALPVPDNPRVRRELKRYLAKPGNLALIEERAQPYLFHILEEIERRDMPPEIALLPVVESAYRPFAYSAGHAAGIWQVIPSTGDLLGLKRTWWYDGRRDIVASTDAALDYLERLHARFGSDWELALAAYNSGDGTVSRAIRKNRDKGLPTDYWALDLPRETETYVPRLLALTRLVAAPESFGISLNAIPNEPYFTGVDIDGQLDLGLAAELAGVSIDELHRLNPGFNRWATDPDGPYRLYLPADRAQRFQRRLAKVPADERLRWQRYRIRSGDTLSEIAQTHDVSIEMLKRANHIKGSRIVAGKQLLIPSPNPSLGPATQGGDNDIADTDPASTPSPRRYRVRGGDTLWRIARRHQVDYKQLARWNRIDENEMLQPGQVLVLNAPIDSSKAPTEGGPLHYVVRSGDSLSTIAHRFKVTVKALRRWNQLSTSRLMPGQRLVLYLNYGDRQTL